MKNKCDSLNGMECQTILLQPESPPFSVNKNKDVKQILGRRHKMQNTQSIIIEHLCIDKILY